MSIFLENIIVFDSSKYNLKQIERLNSFIMKKKGVSFVENEEIHLFKYKVDMDSEDFFQFTKEVEAFINTEIDIPQVDFQKLLKRYIESGRYKKVSRREFR